MRGIFVYIYNNITGPVPDHATRLGTAWAACRDQQVCLRQEHRATGQTGRELTLLAMCVPGPRR